MNALCKFDDEESLIKLSRMTTEHAQLENTDTNLIVEEKIIKTRDGENLSIVIYKSKEAKPDAIGLLWIHGGGYAMNTAYGEGEMAKLFMDNANTVVVSPNYTLSVDAPYPAALNDCYDTLLWMKENATELGINTDQLFVGGGSAGGGLTAAVSLYARDHEDVNIAFQMPLYPMLNDKMDTPASVNNYGFLWDSKRNKVAWEVYLGNLVGTDDIPYYASPARATDYSNLPSTFTYVGTLDSFLDDTIQYAENLMEAGVPVEYYTYEGGFHGFDGFDSEISNDAKEKLMEAYRNAAQNCFVPQD